MADLDLRLAQSVAVEAAHKAGKRTLAYFNAGVEVDEKSDDTPVTIADREAEHVVRDYLAKHFPTHTIVGEEHPDAPGDPNFKWIIDPIDGTKSFIHGVPLYGVLIGLEVRGRIDVGVIHMPALGETICAARGEGAYFNGGRCKCSDVTRIEDATILAGSITRVIDRSDAYRSLADRAKLNRGWGDAFGYALVATGRADLMLDPKIAPWDCAPMPVILEESDGWAGNWDGQQDIYGPNWLAVTGGLKGAVLAELGQHPKRETWAY
ncbi:MAG: inositol monophosphatase family protein [Planctomycetota bacterium]